MQSNNGYFLMIQDLASYKAYVHFYGWIDLQLFKPPRLGDVGSFTPVR